MSQSVDISELETFTADYWRLAPSEVNDALVFGASAINKFSSVRFFRFLAALEDNFGVRVSDPGAITTFGALQALVLADTAPTRPSEAPIAVPPAARSATTEQSAQPGVSAVGHDIEEIANLPDVSDYRTDTFYTSHFTPAEIEYCLQSTNPRQHFAARFCAKEAVRKCGPNFAALHPRSIEIVNSESGKPAICIRQEPNASVSGPRLLLSLAHSDHLASAFVVVTN